MKTLLMAGVAALALGGSAFAADGVIGSGVLGGTGVILEGGPGRSSAYVGVQTKANASTTLVGDTSRSSGGSSTGAAGKTRGNAAVDAIGGSTFKAGSFGVVGHRHHDN